MEMPRLKRVSHFLHVKNPCNCKVLKSLPEKLLESDTVYTDSKKDVVKLWTDFIV